jgi:hypothetical protein
MATNKRPIFINTVVSTVIEIDNADGTAVQTVLAGGTDGSGVTNLTATTTDTSAVIAVLTMTDGSTTNVLGEVNVPAGSGTDGASPAVNLLEALDIPGAFQADGSILVGANATLQVNAKSAVTAAKVLSVTAAGGSYSA